MAKTVHLSETTASILYARGVDSAEKVRSFLNPSKEHFLSPFLMKGMKEATELIKEARDGEWRVAVFGDYDADGIGALAILSRALKEFGIEPYLYVPERTEGYGMSITAIDQIFDEFLPDLVITVDCGISNREEVEYIKEQGAYVIVTDHHELPDELPDCITINPKLHDDYPYDNLCGAGVAYKLATALIGEKAESLLDFCALSTVADSVPLTGENRDIVAEGLKKINSSPRPAFRALLEKEEEVTAQTLSFQIAPRINAAGRMGDVHAALQLFTSDDPAEIYALAAKLTAYNSERQRRCDEMYTQAKAQLLKKGAYRNAIVLAGENWSAGFVGIVAARFTEEFCRPALLFVKKGDHYKGSARSVEGINIYESLKAVSEYITEFGGHAQAAGVNVKEENFALFEEALDRYISAHYPEDSFTPTVVVSGEFQGKIPPAVARELNLLEPFGVGNRRPLFLIREQKLNANLLRPFSPHVSMTSGGNEFMYFGGASYLPVLRSDAEKSLVFECNLSKYRGKEYYKSFVRTVITDGMSGKDGDLAAFESALHALKGQKQAERTQEDIDALIAEKRAQSPYGLVVIAYDRGSISRYPALDGMAADLFFPADPSVKNTLLAAPAASVDLSAYRDVILLDLPYLALRTGDATVAAAPRSVDFSGLDCSREGLLSVFSRLRSFDGRVSGEALYEAAQNGEGILGVEKRQLLFALVVFEELGLAVRRDGAITVQRGVKTALENSRVYCAISAMQQ